MNNWNVFLPFWGTVFVAQFINICTHTKIGVKVFLPATWIPSQLTTVTPSTFGFKIFKIAVSWNPAKQTPGKYPWILLTQRDFETRPNQLTIGHVKIVDWHAINFLIRILHEAKVFCNCRVGGIREKSCWGKETLRKLPRFPFLLWKQLASTLMSQTHWNSTNKCTRISLAYSHRIEWWNSS